MVGVRSGSVEGGGGIVRVCSLQQGVIAFREKIDSWDTGKIMWWKQKMLLFL